LREKVPKRQNSLAQSESLKAKTWETKTVS